MSRRSKPVEPIVIPPASPVIGCTIITPGYETLGFEAVRRFKAMTGLDTVILFSESRGYFKKLDLPELLGPVTVIYYDADLWFIRPLAPGRYVGTTRFWAVHDPSAFSDKCFTGADCLKERIAPQDYVNTGLMIWNNNLASHRAIFERARALYNYSAERGIKRLIDVTEQGWINLALKHTPFNKLGLEYNYFYWLEKSGFAPPPENIIGLHAAGYPLEHKFLHLQTVLPNASFPSVSPAREGSGNQVGGYPWALGRVDCRDADRGRIILVQAAAGCGCAS